MLEFIINVNHTLALSYFCVLLIQREGNKYPYFEYMMKDTKTEKDKLHRYLDDLYTRDDASQL